MALRCQSVNRMVVALPASYVELEVHLLVEVVQDLEAKRIGTTNRRKVSFADFI